MLIEPNQSPVQSEKHQIPDRFRADRIQYNYVIIIVDAKDFRS